MKRWIVDENVAWEAVGEEMVALRLADGRYFELNETAAMIFKLIAAGSDEDEIVELLCGEYEIEDARARQDTRALAESLIEHGLITTA